MAPYALRLRRALSLSSSLLHHSLHRPSSTPPLTFSAAPLIPQNPSTILNPSFSRPPSRFFTSTTTSLSVSRNPYESDNDEIGPETTLFEGCDYKHWLITVDFPKDPAPSREEMISFYEQAAVKVFGSLEEARERIYACSTTTYQGFQVVCSEERSEKFRDIPGVVFVLPDSYIDPVNKEYGGDKYIKGEIIPRPPPVQYGRQGPRRDFRSRPSPRGHMQGDTRNYGPPQTPPPHQNFGQRPHPQQNFGQPPPPQQNFGQPRPPHQQNFGMPPSQQNFGQPHQPHQQNFGIPPPQQNYGQPHPPHQNYGPPHNFPPQQNNGPPGAGEQRGPPVSNVPEGWNNPQGGRGDSMPSYQPNYNQGDRGNLYSQGQSDFPHGDQWSSPQGGSFGQAHSQNYPTDQRNTTQGVGQTSYAADQGRQ